jgi:hypothetical protein
MSSNIALRRSPKPVRRRPYSFVLFDEIEKAHVIRLDADKQLCQLPESGQKKASFAHLARRPRGPILACLG